MKAVRLHQPGSAEGYVYEDAPEPVAAPGEALVRVRAVALNHLEAWAAKMPGAAYAQPRILGSDVAGVVEALGEGVRSIGVGDEVMLHPGVSCGVCEACLGGTDNVCPRYHLLGQGRDGGMAELVSVPAANVFAKPANLSFEDAASIPLVFTTALHMILTRAQLRYGETVLVNAAGSGVGVAAILTGGCAWRQMAGTPRAALAERPPAKARVTLLDGREQVVLHPIARGDSLFGDRTALPLDSIRSVESYGPRGDLIALDLFAAALGAGVFLLIR